MSAHPHANEGVEYTAIGTWSNLLRSFDYARVNPHGHMAGWLPHLPSMRSTRVVEVGLDVAGRMIDDFDHYVQDARFDDSPVLERMLRSQKRPFESTFIGVRAPERHFYGNGAYIGWLVSDLSYVAFYVQQYDDPKKESSVFLIDIGSGRERPNGRDTFSVGAAIFPDLLFQLMAREVHVVRESKLMPSHREIVRSELGGKGQLIAPIPRAYHKILVTGSTTWADENRRAIVSAGHTWKLQHRIDVRAHWWIRVREGEGLVPEEFRERLDPSYIWIDDHSPDIDAETWELVASRGVAPRRSGHWMGILKRWIGPHQRGPVDAPYVPALWVVEPGGTP